MLSIIVKHHIRPMANLNSHLQRIFRYSKLSNFGQLCRSLQNSNNINRYLSVTSTNYNRSQVDKKNVATKTFSTEDEIDMMQKLKNKFDNDFNQNGVVPVFKKALLYGNKIAIKDHHGEFSYIRLYMGAKKLSIQISNLCGSASSSRVAFLCPNDITYPLIQWACWFSGQIVVPLTPKHPEDMLKYFINDSGATLLISTPEYEPIMRPIAESLEKLLIVIDHTFIPIADIQGSWLDPKNENILNLHGDLIVEGAMNPEFYRDNNAMILYTSGTTGNPKGVILSHKNLGSQVHALTDAWEFNSKDCLLHVLPLNHVHGCINALMCPLDTGAKTIMLPRYDNNTVWSHLLNINLPGKDRVNVFMAVPTIYSFLIEEYNKIFSKNDRMCEYIKSHCENKIRLMVSGSAPLPNTVFNKWKEISGHNLLERYGMTEIGMALSNPYIQDKVRKRIPGSVGAPLPNVEVKIVSPSDQTTLYQAKGEFGKGIWSKVELPVYENISQNQQESNNLTGDLYVRGTSVFKGYWNKPEATQQEFINGWFKTGDTVSADDNGYFRILGRTNTDIIKTGGHKVSALEIETNLIEHPYIDDVVVVGLPDDVWGQKIAAVIVCNETLQEDFTLKMLQDFCSTKMASYAIPTIMTKIKEVPRNALGKVNKNEIVATIFPESIGQQIKTQ